MAKPYSSIFYPDTDKACHFEESPGFFLDVWAGETVIAERLSEAVNVTWGEQAKKPEKPGPCPGQVTCVFCSWSGMIADWPK